MATINRNDWPRSIGIGGHHQSEKSYGTSTGSIIAALISLGYTVDEVHTLYKAHVPKIMRTLTASGKSAALAELTNQIFMEKKFEDVKTGIGIVATRWMLERPMIFKGDVGQAHGRIGSFAPGFGCTIAEAVQASCSAYPFFNRKIVSTSTYGKVELIDGGFCANNPTLYAIADGTVALKREHKDLRVVSVGVGIYPKPKRGLIRRRIESFWPVELLQKTLEVNTQSMEQLRTILYKDIPTIRICETFERPEMATDLLEHDLEKLDMLYQRGRESYAKREEELMTFFA